LCRRGRCWRGGCEEIFKRRDAEKELRKEQKDTGLKPGVYKTSSMLSYEQARNKVIEEIGKRTVPGVSIRVSVWEALGLCWQRM